MTHMTYAQTVNDFPRLKARTSRFSGGEPRSATVVGDGSRVLFLRSDGSEDLVTSLWMDTLDPDGGHRETLIADPRQLLANADEEDVPAQERARRERARESGRGIVSYHADAAGERVVFTIDGALFLAELGGTDQRVSVRRLAEESLTAQHPQRLPVLNPRIAPNGRHVAYTTGQAIAMVDVDGGTVSIVQSTEADETHRIGLAEFVAGEEMDRYEGFWWSPDSDALLVETFDSSAEPVWYISDPANPERPASPRRYPRALTHNADVRMAHVALAFDTLGHYEGAQVKPVEWDRAGYEYLAAVSWRRGHDPVLLVQNRRQTRNQVLRVDVNGGGTTTVLEEHHNDQWLDIVLGTPQLTPDGRLICASSDMDTDTNRLTVDGKPFTPVGWQVRRVLDVSDDNVLAVVQRTPEYAQWVPEAWSDCADSHDARSQDVVTIDYTGRVSPVSVEPGMWTAARSSSGLVVSGRTMDDAHATMTHRWQPEGNGSMARHDDAAVSAAIANHAAEPGFVPNTTFVRLGEHRLFTAVTRPGKDSVYAGAKKLPVLLKPYGGPGFQQVSLSQAFYWESQWWADQGFVVVTSDGRGTTGRGPAWDRAIFKHMKDVTLADQVETVQALADVAPDADLDHVAMIGWSYGGFLSALAVLDAPDVVQAACAGAPPTDWTLYDTHYTERYLGLDPSVYVRNSIIDDAPKLRRPLMLIHGFSDDNVSIANSLRLSQALMAAGREHTYLPLTGITHMTNDETVAENLLIVQRDFLYRAFSITPKAA